MLLWRLPASVRSFTVQNCRRATSVCSQSSWSRPFSTATSQRSESKPHDQSRAADPLRILFCGADDFSAHSLRALDLARKEGHNVESIEVVHRPGKPAGRGRKIIRELPIKRVACEELQLPTHEIDTFTGWTPPTPYNMIIAVSFGLFVPSRILKGAKYGGLNVHPSLLPDLYGPAPLHHTLLKQREYMGVTVQTLHHKHFDKGTVLAQTPAPGIVVPQDTNFHELTETLGHIGGDMLVNVLSDNLFVPPLEDKGWYAQSGGPVHHAEKITKDHSYVNFETATASAVMAAHRALGDLWCKLPNGERVILNKLDQADKGGPEEPGLFCQDGESELAAKTADGEILQVLASTIAGGKRGQGNRSVGQILQMFKGKG